MVSSTDVVWVVNSVLKVILTGESGMQDPLLSPLRLPCLVTESGMLSSLHALRSDCDDAASENTPGSYPLSLRLHYRRLFLP